MISDGLFFHSILLHARSNTGKVFIRSVIAGYGMFLKVQMPWNVIIPADSLDPKGLMLKKAIVIRLMDEFATKKATKDLGYFVAVTTLETIGEGRVRQNTGDVLFPCGPVQNIYLSHIKMPDYRYVPGENGMFMNDKHWKTQKDVVIRFIVIGTKWMEAERESQALVSSEGDYLGPVS
ncbi:DNA-directed RNA polymerase V subunit 7 [Hibiscus syriacus]|uniref:DNA-directed RNA polymerase subunit n=1 Tax=Hibiscus syriacus TaxID=106335 RepID=A0A6A2YY57_HIBSY|nr:DNA-directed RNA polymerase V subunit 7 [Hibiscus syriacus]